MKIKIIYVVPRLAKAGTEKHLINLASGLDKTKFEVTICCLFVNSDYCGFKNTDSHGFGDTNCHELSGQSALKKVICLRRRNIYDLRIIFDLYRLIKKEKYDIVHTYLFGFHYLAAIPAKIARVAVVISSRRELATWKKWYHHLLENLGNLFTDKVVACSQAARQFALSTENLTPDKIITIYNGIDLQKFYPHPKSVRVLNELGLGEKDKIFAMVANFSRVKDHETLLKAIAEVKKIYPGVKCLLVGDGPLRKDIEKSAKGLKLEENVIFTGLRDDIPAVLSIMDIFVLTSLREGLPNVILEATACGLAVVATNVGGIPELVENGKSGVSVQPRDHQAVADAIIKLLNNEDLKKEMGRRGREIVESKFGLVRMVRDYESLYENDLFEMKSKSYLKIII